MTTVTKPKTVDTAKKQRKQPATFESVWTALQESNRFLTEKFAETDRLLTKNAAEAEQRLKVLEQSLKETTKLVGGIANSNGDVAESYFVNSFAKHLHFAGQDFDSHSSKLVKNVKKLNLQDEYDLVLYNCTSVVIIEIKYKVKQENIQQALKKAKTFKQLFPEYANYNLYLGLAGLDVEIDAEKEALSQGIAIIKQVGDNMVIHDKDLKVF